MKYFQLLLIILLGSTMQLQAQKDSSAKKGTGVYTNNRSITIVDGQVFYDDQKNMEDDGKNTTSKEISIETMCAANATVFVENIYRKIIVKTTSENKVKISTTVFYKGESKLTDAEWFEKMNLEIKGSNNNIVVKSASISTDNTNKSLRLSGLQTTGFKTGTNTFSSFSTGSKNTTVAVFDGEGNWVKSKSNEQRVVTIYMPAGAKLDVESKFADVDIQNDLRILKADITNASLRILNIDQVNIQGKYASIKTGNIKDADIELMNGRFLGGNISTAKFDSKYSTVEFGTANTVQLESTNDQYEIDEAGEIKGHKSYGDIRITNLRNTFDLTGNNTDIKIRNLAATVSSVKIDNKYADIRLPVNNLSSYAVDFQGTNCNIYAPFEQISVVNREPVKEVVVNGKSLKSAQQTVITVEGKPAKKSDVNEIVVTGKSAEKTAMQTAQQAKQQADQHYQLAQQQRKLTETAREDARLFKDLTITGTKLGGLPGNFPAYNFNYGAARNSSFKTTVGDNKNVHTNFQIKCTNCTVDFK